jgi:hypothetical protein
MTDGKRKALRIAAGVLLLMSLAGQVLVIIIVSSRFSCGETPDWGDWLACLHEGETSPVLMAEGCVVVWLIGGIGGLLGRFLPPYISVIVPVGVAVAVIWFVYENLDLPDQLPPLWYMSIFVIGAGGIAIVLGGPVVGAWLWGFARRGRRRSLLRLSAVFDSAT